MVTGMDTEFYEEVAVTLALAEAVSAGRLNRILRDLGATLYYDVYSFDRPDKHPRWQSEAFASVDLTLNGERADAQDGADTIRVSYPLATVPSTFIGPYVELVYTLADRLDGVPVHYDGRPITAPELTVELERMVTELMTEWGEEPGSQTLVMMIESQYGPR